MGYKFRVSILKTGPGIFPGPFKPAELSSAYRSTPCGGYFYFSIGAKIQIEPNSHKNYLLFWVDVE